MSHLTRRSLVLLLLAVIASASPGANTARASSMDGTWRIEDLVLTIFDCKDRVCGRIVWIKDEARRASQCGKTIVWGLAQSGPTDWKEGSILDPDDGSTYSLNASFHQDGGLYARIFAGIEMLGKTKILKRVDLNALSGRC